MNETIHRYTKPKDTIFYQITFLVVLGLYGFGLFKSTLALFEEFTLIKLILLLSLFAISLWLIYIAYQIILLRREYDKIDGGKVIIIDHNLRQLNIKQAESERLIKHGEIKSAELYESWSAAYPLGYFKFIILVLFNGDCVLITGYTLPFPEEDLSRVLKGIKITRHKRFINHIKNNCCQQRV